MAKLFGTDGARGVANTELTCDIAFKLGQAAVALFGKTVVVGRDTRVSGQMLECALKAGVMSLGGTVRTCGILPTPGIAFVTRTLDADCGIVISASHNPPQYNGIKFFDGQGFKLADEVEAKLEAYVLAGGAKPGELASGASVGKEEPIENAKELYVANAVNTVAGEGLPFSSLKVALDTGHGASCDTTRAALEQLGVEVVAINGDLDGSIINVECGSTHLGPLREMVAKTGADLGIAHDGDADRVMFVDAQGNEIDGDVVEAVCALDLKKRGLLAGNTVVSTVMCNLGFMKCMEAAGINVIQTSVGDKYVLQQLREGGYRIGGEQSGHMIFLEHNSTGDGLLTALQFVAAVLRQGVTVAEAASVMQRFPQELINVRVSDKNAVRENAAVAAIIDSKDKEMAGLGRILVRPSGTEPLVRVMVEAPTHEAAHEVAQQIADVIEAEMGI